ncbi:hypothetical protein AB9E06_33590 [Rhizobium leguminosarum]|uniref:5'-methylthioadenosine/S-adenosylhomocysteine nucleosidase family protein n=1 Tax=Rhizobium leguminosarum TaxID=384 RepID=UPI003F98AD6D
MKRRIKLLIIDDIEKKRTEVKAQLTRFGKSVDFIFTEAGNYEQARDALRSGSFDFVILDLMIPAGQEDPSEAWSRTLLMDILGGELCFPMHIFGLTEHASLMDSERRYYDQNLFGLFEFKWDNDDWAMAIWNKISYLISAIENGASYRLNSFDFDIVIVTARRRNEFVPVKGYLFKDDPSDPNPLWNEKYSHFGRIKLPSGQNLRTALLCIGETGLAPAATITTQAIQMLRPRLIVMLGMCAGFESKGMKLLDVIVARETACWQEGKSLDTDAGETFDPRGEVRSWSDGVGTQFRLSFEMSEKEYSSALATVKETVPYFKLQQLYGDAVSENLNVKPGLLVSGSSIVASKATRAEILARHARAIGLEMEAFSIYTAAKYSKGARPEYLTIKGVADLADNAKGDEAQALASELSARVLEFFLNNSDTSYLGGNHQ